MKKYISILSLVTAFALQSCDRSDLVTNSNEQILTRGQKSQEKFSALTETLNPEGHPEMSKPGTGDDDEPRKDKSHWRIPTDTIRP